MDKPVKYEIFYSKWEQYNLNMTKHTSALNIQLYENIIVTISTV